MNLAAVLLGGGAGAGVCALAFALRGRNLHLADIDLTVSGTRVSPDWRERVLAPAEHVVQRQGRWWPTIQRDLQVSDTGLREVVSRSLAAALLGLFSPLLVWILLTVGGGTWSFAVASIVALATGLAGALWPWWALSRRASLRRRHLQAFVGTYVDLLVLCLAGGMGVESALLVAAQATEDWAARQMASVLLAARESGTAPWVAMVRWADGVGADEVSELAASLQLAGTEGARIRQSLTARSSSLRRRQQAEVESQANRATERLFLPGSLLLVGFLLFIGYPAFSRIVGAF